MAPKGAPIKSDMDRFREKLGKRYGTRLTRTDVPIVYDVVSTGSIELDHALGVGGWVQGRTHEIVGPPGVCKTSLCIHSAVEHQRKLPQKAVGWIDMEQSFDFGWAERLGLDTDSDLFTHIYPDDSEDVADILKMMAQTGLYSLLVVDSIGGMESKKAFEKDAEDVVMGKNAQVITRMVKQVATLARQHNITVLFVNQYRANLSYAGGDKPAGPKALGYNTTTSIRLAPASGEAKNTLCKIKDGDDEIIVGRKMVAKVNRSRVSPQGRKGEFWFFNLATEEYGPVGIDRVDEAFSLGIRTGVIKQGGSWYTLPGDEKAINSRGEAVLALKQRPETVEMIRKEALALIAGDNVKETEIVFQEGSNE